MVYKTRNKLNGRYNKKKKKEKKTASTVSINNKTWLKIKKV